MKSTKQLASNIAGQLNGIIKMIDDGQDCHKILIQMKAVKSATSSMMKKFIEENFQGCLNNPTSKKNKETLKELFKELNK